MFPVPIHAMLMQFTNTVIETLTLWEYTQSSLLNSSCKITVGNWAHQKHVDSRPLSLFPVKGKPISSFIWELPHQKCRVYKFSWNKQLQQSTAQHHAKVQQETRFWVGLSPLAKTTVIVWHDCAMWQISEKSLFQNYKRQTLTLKYKRVTFVTQ